MTELKISSNGDSVFSNNPSGLTSKDLSVTYEDNFYIFRGRAIAKSFSIVPDDASLETEYNVTPNGLVVSFFDDFLQDNVQSGFKFILNPTENLPTVVYTTPAPLPLSNEVPGGDGDGEKLGDGGETEENPDGGDYTTDGNLVKNNETTTTTTNTNTGVDEELTFKYRL